MRENECDSFRLFGEETKLIENGERFDRKRAGDNNINNVVSLLKRERNNQEMNFSWTADTFLYTNFIWQVTPVVNLINILRL